MEPNHTAANPDSAENAQPASSPPSIVYDTEAATPRSRWRALMPFVVVVLGVAIGIAAWSATRPQPANSAAGGEDDGRRGPRHYRSSGEPLSNPVSVNRPPGNDPPADNIPPRGAPPVDAPTPPPDNIPGPEAGTDSPGENVAVPSANLPPRGDRVPPGLILPQEPEAIEVDGFPLAGSHPLVAQLLSLLRFKDFPAIVKLLEQLRLTPERAWLVVASALVLTDDMASRAVLVGILAGDFPELDWVGDPPNLARATDILFSWLLLHNPEWVRPRGAGYLPFQKQMLVTMFRRGSPPAPAVVGSASISNTVQMRVMLGMVRETDDEDVRVALLDFCGRRMAGVAPADRAGVILDVMVNLRDNLANALEPLSALLAAIWMTDADTGADVLSDALLNGDADVRRAAAIKALQAGWDQARLVPADNLWQHLLDGAVPPAGNRPMTGESRVEAAELIDEILSADALDEAQRKQLNSRLETAVFNANNEPTDAWQSELRSRQVALLAWLRPDDGDLMARIHRLARQDPDATVQLAAWTALGTMSPPAVGDALRNAARDNATGVAARTTALQALAEWSDWIGGGEPDNSRAVFAQLLNNPDAPSSVRATSARLLGERSAFDAAHRALVRRMAEKDADAAVRTAAINGYALGTPTDPESEREAVNWLKNRSRLDPSPVVRNAADRALKLLPLTRDDR